MTSRRHDGKRITVYERDQVGRYVRRDSSIVLPDLPIEKIAEFVERIKTMSRTDLLVAFRDWIRAEILPRRKK